MAKSYKFGKVSGRVIDKCYSVSVRRSYLIEGERLHSVTVHRDRVTRHYIGTPASLVRVRSLDMEFEHISTYNEYNLWSV